MSTTTNNNAHGASLRILEYWHNIEFFIPYDLQGEVLEEKSTHVNVRQFTRDQLAVADSSTLWNVLPPFNKELKSFDLFLNLFDKRELAQVTQRVLKQSLAPGEQFTQEERADLEGVTCSALLKANKHGELVLENVSVCTAPWAMGRIALYHLAGLDIEMFQASLTTFKNTLQAFACQRLAHHARQATEDSAADEEQCFPLDAAELLTLSNLVTEWSGYQPAGTPPDRPLLVIRANFGEIKKKLATATTVAPEEDDDTATQEKDVSILNSFYAQDIARAMQDLRQGVPMPVLEAYLAPAPAAARLDLYQPAGRAQIAAMLTPGNLPRGHWPDNPTHTMSLMQQFAINAIFQKLDVSGIFSVNGPPGTGKTTLLRDIFADNIVRRARALATFDTAGAAFKPDKVKVSFRGAPACTISQLRDELGGFEMVVASSNNAAVENISRDLPKTKSLGELAWRDAHGTATIGYLQTVAHNIAARNSKGNYDALAKEDIPWGLISCALGKFENRKAFREGIGHAGSWDPKKRATGYDPNKHQSLWDWRDQPAATSYAQARENFLLIDEEVRTRIGQLEHYAALRSSTRGHTQASFSAPQQRAVVAAQQEFDHASAASISASEDRQHCLAQLTLLKADEERIEKGRPFWWARWIKSAKALAFAHALAANLAQQGNWLQRQREAKAASFTAKRAGQHAAHTLLAAQQELTAACSRWGQLQQALHQLSQNAPLAASPDSPEMLEQDRWQIDSLWRDELLNARRGALLVAALELQQAWLAESLKKGGGLGANIVALSHLLAGKRLEDAEHALALWRSLFMIVPVVSTTLASFANQFRNLGANTIGWLFIDEAGQAVPQAAVGALWRARRAVVVGDPKQIEPVFTVPIKLIEALAQHAQLPEERALAPHQSSVQALADAANPLGTAVDVNGTPRWIGSPLRVHRRCVEPMFSISNAIAYNNKMVFFAPEDPARRLPPDDSLNLGDSAWVDVAGATNSKQSVPAQVTLVLQAVVALYDRTGTLAPLYIVSPFKRIKNELMETLERLEHWRAVAAPGARLPAQSALTKWCTARIGTVHTFQGKEESIVWMVLGCDQETQAAAQWASEKPNILNVALTRAKHRFFMIGDAALWGKQPHFSVACSTLPAVSGQRFLQRIREMPYQLVQATATQAPLLPDAVMACAPKPGCA